MSGTWLDFCRRRDGPVSKQGYATALARKLTAIEGIVSHSMEGFRAGAYSVLDDPNRRSSWTFSVYQAQNSPSEQHYPLESVTWHAGTFDGNVLYVGIEHEGVKGQPLTDWQVDQTVKIQKAILDLCPKVQPVRKVGLWEHKEVGLTSCPNDRIPWERIVPALTEEETDMKAIVIINSKGTQAMLAADGRKYPIGSQKHKQGLIDAGLVAAGDGPVTIPDDEFDAIPNG